MINSYSFLQTESVPFDELDELSGYLNWLRDQGVSWDTVGILVDDGPKSVIVFLLTQEEIKSVLRFSIDTGKTIEGFKLLSPLLDNIKYRYIDKRTIKYEDLISLDALESLWRSPCCIESLLKPSEVEDFTLRLEDPELQKGRGPNILLKTKNQVWFESHGRCMFEGCAVKLRVDEITGKEGSYDYLAHNVASSEQGPRGIFFLSHQLSNDPKNILLLCDKHHRLIDRVAVPDYPPSRLSSMRKGYIDSANKLLNSLAHHPVSVYSVLWPVQKTTISAPSDLQVNESLNKLNWRMSNEMNVLSDNDAMLKDFSSEISWGLIPELIDIAFKEIIQQTRKSNYRAGLFAFGLMPALIGLGAKLGNKNEIYPMLRYRDGGQWAWPLDVPRVELPYQIQGLEKLEYDESEVILTLAFTGNPLQFKNFQKENASMKVIEIVANELGNGAIGHPLEGIEFMTDLQKLLLKLRNEYDVKKIHVLPCISNAGCVFFGKAYDNHHPELVIYDFSDDNMVPKLRVYTEDGRCEIEVAQ